MQQNGQASELFIVVNLLYKSIKQFEVEEQPVPEEQKRLLGEKELIKSLAFPDRES